MNELIDWEDYPQVMINVDIKNKSDWESKADIVIKEAENYLRDKGRVVVRSSGTEPLIRVMVETQSLSVAQMWAQKIVDSM